MKSMRIDRRRFLELGLAGAAASACTPARAPAQRPRLEPLAGKIEHFVVLMMENRSYDEMLGGLPGEKYAGAPAGTKLTYATPSGLRDVELRHGAPRDWFYPDPPHRFQKVQRQIFGRGPNAPADMGGFAQAYAAESPVVEGLALGISDYATHYASGQLPILQTLAQEYAVCTHWFASLPGPTTPNRMFVHAGTSGGTVSQGLYFSRVRGKMIFDLLGGDDRLWRIYYHDIPHVWLTGDMWIKGFAGQQRRFGRFREDVRRDNLPVYSFLEPQHVIPPWTSQHPFWGVSHGEALIARVYNDLVENPRVFEKTLLVVVWDEHGGFYDHVVPPGHAGWNAARPDIQHEVLSPDGNRDNPFGFDFTRLGVRVPAVAISPWIERGSVFGWNAENAEDRHTFDHTSVLSTVGKMTGVWVDSARARRATSLEVTLNRATPRRDASRLVYRSGAYRETRGGVHVALDDIPGPGKEVCDAFRVAQGRDASPEAIARYFDDLVASG